MTRTLSLVPQKSQEFASVRLPVSLKRKATQIGKLQRWSLSKTLYVLIEEAISERERLARQADMAGVLEPRDKGKAVEAEGLR